MVRAVLVQFKRVLHAEGCRPAHRAFGRCRRKAAHVLLLALAVASVADDAHADTSWGGSLALTSDYLVRGVSRSNDHAAVQLDLHLATDAGWIAGVFASNAQTADQPRDAELDAFMGYAWSGGSDWRSGVRATYYSYPWNQAGTGYDYAELNVDVIYRDSLQLAAIYSPDEPHYVPYRGLVRASSTSMEANFQHRIYRQLSATAGAGYSRQGGPVAGGYGYGSVGLACIWGSAALTVAYVDTAGAPKSLFYRDDAPSHWTASIIYRF